jgi:hypothetical protein
MRRSSPRTHAYPTDPTERPKRELPVPKDSFDVALAYAKKHKKRLTAALIAAVALYAFYVWWTWPRPDPARSRLAPGQSVTIHADDTARITAYEGTDNPVELIRNARATVISDAIPDLNDQPEPKPGVGLGVKRPVQIRLEETTQAGKVVTVERGHLRPAQ